MKSIHNQKGAVLIVSLIILLVLTLIGVSAARTVLMGEKMTFASRDSRVALEVAESLVKQGEVYIDGLDNTDNFGTTGWLYAEGTGPTDLLDGDVWDGSNSTKRSVKMKGPDGKELDGRFYIEDSGLAIDNSQLTDVDLSADTVGGFDSDVRVFKIVARGEGIGGTERILITHYGKKF